MVERVAGRVRHDLDDATQETLVRMLAVDADRFDPGFGIEGFAARRVMWTVRDMRRREAARGRTEARSANGANDDAPSPEVLHLARLEAAAAAAAARKLKIALGELPADVRGVIQRHDLQGRPLRELARQSGENVSSLSRRRERGLRSLSERMS